MTHMRVVLVPALLLTLLGVLASEHQRDIEDAVEVLARELRNAGRRFRVFSAETTHGKEAEFIRDRPPQRASTALWIAVLVLCAAAAWWLTR